MLKKSALAYLFLVFTGLISCAQKIESDRPSPPAQARCEFSSGKTITVGYSSPRMKGRQIFGELVPYGEVWRTGANEATTFVANETLMTVGGVNIPAGTYTIFTVPNRDNWILIINKHTNEWGIPYKYQSEELVRVPMSVARVASTVENFTISFDPTGESCMMNMGWENTQAWVEFTEKNTDLFVSD